MRKVIHGLKYWLPSAGLLAALPSPIVPALQLNNQACTDFRFYGAVGDGKTDNTAAWTNFLRARPPCLSVPPGKFLFNSSLVLTLPNKIAAFTLRGSGQEVTEFSWPNANGGMTINYITGKNSARVHDITFSTGQINNGTALQLNQLQSPITAPNSPQTTIVRFAERGADGLTGKNYWAKGLGILGVSMVSIDSSVFSGTPTGNVGGYVENGIGIDIEGTVSALAVVFNITNSSFTYNRGLVYGANVQGVTVNQSNFVGGNFGIYVPSGLPAGGAQLSVIASQFNVATAAISENSNIINVSIGPNNLFLLPQSGSLGVDLEQASYAVVQDNQFVPTTTLGFGSAIKFNSLGVGLVIARGNLEEGVGLGTLITAGSQAVKLIDNSYKDNRVNVLNLGVSSNIIDVPQDCSEYALEFGGRSTGITYGTKTCTFVDDGTTTTLNLRLSLTSKGTSKGNAGISRIPNITPPVTYDGSCVLVSYFNMSEMGMTNFYIPNNNAVIFMQKGGPGDTQTAYQDTNFTNTSAMVVNCSYFDK